MPCRARWRPDGARTQLSDLLGLSQPVHKLFGHAKPWAISPGDVFNIAQPLKVSYSGLQIVVNISVILEQWTRRIY